ncbi:MAG: hypothetical protein J7L71_11210 [Spirochaetaceae bacterium]|nr:hypothetical protein [Spirochaetaceae bacterium]
MNRKLGFVLIVSFVGVFLNSPLFSQSLKGLSLGGTTGLITTPTGRIGWENSSDLGLDIGYHFSTDQGFGENESIINAALSISRKFEAGVTMDFQQDNDGDDESGEETDLHFFGKFQMYNSGNSGMAVGVNFQMIDFLSNDENRPGKGSYSQVYFVTTYSGNFMQIPAATTILFGKTFNIDEGLNNRLDFSMGFDLTLFPDVFHGFFHWISEFSNYSYSVDSHITNAAARGAFNTGLRMDILANSEYKFVIDAVLMDVFDDGIDSFSVGGTIGFSLK